MKENIRTLRLGDILKESGYVTEEQIEEAVVYQKSHRGTRIGTALIELGFLDEPKLLHALGKRLNYPVIDLSSVDVQIGAVEKVPRSLAEKYGMIALEEREGVLILAVNDPLNFYGIEDIRQVTGMQLQICLTTQKAIARAINYYYAEVGAKQAAETANLSFQQEEEVELEEDGNDDTPIINLLNRLINRAYNTNTSDIHIEPFENKTMVRLRIDGVLVDYVTLQKSLHSSLIARIKILGSMDIAERRIPQDGHFRMKIEGDYINIRVSVIPTVFGEKAVLRLLAGNMPIDHAGSFGMQEEDCEKLNKMLQSPNGIIYFTGPTGSGKTTTLYMILEELSKRLVNISTIEDPVEKNLARINQMQVNNQSGLTFEVGLRALLRQDPDIIMVGETRDTETAMISSRAAITGHLVLSTLHTSDAVSSVARLEDMGLEPYIVSNSLVGVIAQRLMRKVCRECAEESEPTEEERRILHPGIKKIRRAKGCPMCNNTGYRGRVAIHEIFLVDKEIRRMISQGVPEEEIRRYALEEQHMRTLKEYGIEMVEQGLSTMEEMKKVAYYEE